MGDMARMSRSDRLGEALQPLVKKYYHIRPGDTFTVQSIGVGSNGSYVVEIAALLSGKSVNVEATLEAELFDPDFTDKAMLQERLEDVLQAAPPQEIAAAITAAKLFDTDD